METEEGKEIELRSEELQEVLGEIPHWILRRGIFILFCIIFILLIGSWFFKYPDTVSSSMVLTSSTPPIGIVAKTNGQLMELNVKDKQTVKKDDYLAIIENPASTQDMLYLKKNLELLILHPDSVYYFQNKEMNLGSVQGLYSSFIQSLNNYKKFLDLNYYPQKIALIEKRIQKYKQYHQSICRQEDISKQQYVIASSQFKRDSSLLAIEAISKKNMEDALSSYLQKNLSLEASHASVENIQIEISELEETLLDTKQQYLDNKNTLRSELNTLAIQLMNEIKTWEQTYALTTPTDGIVTFGNYWSNNQHVSTGETVFTIIPSLSNEFLGKASLPVARSGKVKSGQQVNIHFLNYPDNEFGMVKGIVKNISLVPDNGYYVVEISFPNGLMTTYRKELPLSREMPAQADIITEDLRLLERIFLPIKRIFTENI